MSGFTGATADIRTQFGARRAKRQRCHGFRFSAGKVSQMFLKIILAHGQDS